ncbi:MAG: hypothetical protein QM817_06740 [Archangium sp.]
MGKAAKKIIDGLKAAKVSADFQKRIKDLIDEAHDWDDAQAAEVERVIRYVCGAGEEPGTLSSGFVQNCCSQLLQGLSTGRKLDAWDERALDVIVRGRKMYWFWELESWLRDRIVAFPKEPILEEGLVLLRARKLWASDDEVLHAMFSHLGGHLTKDGALTSAGRWMLARIDADADGVFAAARNFSDGKKKSDETSSLYRLLLAHRPKVFDALLPKLKFTKDSQKSYLAEKLLEADAKKYEARAVELIDGLKDALPALLSARNLESFFKGKYREQVKALLLGVIKQKGVTFLDDDGAGDTKQGAYEFAPRALGVDGAIEIWNAYEEENDAVRLGFFEFIEKQGKAKVLPLLIDGLVYPKDPKVEYGFVTHAKYVARLAKLVKPYELEPYAARIEKAFAKNSNKKIREEIDALLGKKGKQPKAAAKAVKIPSGKEGYGFDTYAASVVKAALAATRKAKAKLPSPIERVKLAGFQGEIQLNALVIEGVGETVELELSIPRNRVPSHIDMVEDDRLAKFAKRHGLEEGTDDVPSWGDMYELPWCALIDVQIEAVEAIAEGLKKQGAKLAKNCRCGVGEDDNFWTSGDGFTRKAKSGVKALAKRMQADFAAVCFEDPKRQKTLLT